MKIVIVKLSALGDIIHAMVVLQYIKKYNKEIEIDWVVDEAYKDLLFNHPDIDKVHSIKLKKAKQNKSIFLLLTELFKIRKFGKYDIVIDMQGLIKSALVSRIIRSPIALGFDKNSIRENLASIFYHQTFKYDYDKNIVNRNFELINFSLNLPFKNENIHHKIPFLFPKYENLPSGLSTIKKNIILVPGASLPSKRYSIEGFAKLIDLLDANYLVIWGNNEEKLLAKEIKNLMPNVKICEKLSIGALISLVSMVDLIIGPDTGPTHLGWALNIPSITLFGPTPGYRNAFITKNNKVIESKSKVNPFRINKNDYSIRDISANEVVKIAKSLLV
jgi:heptosyltransferase I